MSTARWSLRLPQAGRILRVASVNTRLTRRYLGAINHTRWTQQSTPSGIRAYASLQKDHQPKQEDAQGQLQAQENGQQTQDSSQGRNSQLAATLAEADTSDLVTEVHIPEDIHGVLPQNHPALSILGNSSLVIQRQLEMMNVMLGFEQANKYIIMDGQGQTLGYVAEQDHGIGQAMARQMFRTHRSFTTHIFDAQEREVLRIHRPFAYINSRIRIYDPVPAGGYEQMETSTSLQGTSTSSALSPSSVSQTSPLKLEEMRIIGEAQQQWAPLRRKYNLFTYRSLSPAPDSDPSVPRIESGQRPTSETTALTESRTPDAAIEAGMAQFAHVNEPFLSWDFTLRGAEGEAVGSVNRNFAGFAREIFTDTGVYALRMDSAAAAVEDGEVTAMTLDQRAVMLATAVSIDFDYFSRHSGVGGGGFMPIFWPMGGGAAEGGAAGAGAGAAGGAVAGEAAATGTAAAEGAAGVGGAATRGLGGAAAGGTEGAIAGAGTMAGYEAMQRGVYGSEAGDDASPTNSEPFASAQDQSPEQSENRPGNDDVWGEGQDPWAGDNQPPAEGGGGGWIDTLSDFFGGD